MNKKHKELVFSGVQPTGNLHLGNYLGAIKNFVDLQKKMLSIYCVVDLHAITVFKDPKELRKNILETTAGFLACGLDFKKSIIFNQSSVSGHSELAWILNCVSRVGWMNRMTQFKEKAGSNKENASVGLYIYPNLMAADILLYKATHVPVGDDQKQHLELARDIAQKFNNDFKSENFFPLPEPLIQKKLSRVMSLRDGQKKMSKSDESDYSRIDLQDTEDEIKKKIKKAKTDSLPIPEKTSDLDKRPEALNLLNIYSFITGKTLEETLKIMKGKDFSKFKGELSDLLVSTICPIGKEIKKLKQDETYLKKVLEEGTNKAKLIAEKNLKEVKEIVGFL
ncbi:MAG: tryptophan--tRNA ligase [Candidatus Marinimicrobia bacterium]|nr:tryptophan--tRNA ligase [Candidatus Neomarinimicrobiota bacterium]RPG05979.1 MAG: tryptophan--tRNA ligase [Pelagibacteraceae bacterium TMED247]|tara:strand:+ start:1550 stop:2560 length:1011 start_codon:yes stop_codon:yes gene_type:complete